MAKNAKNLPNQSPSSSLRCGNDDTDTTLSTFQTHWNHCYVIMQTHPATSIYNSSTIDLHHFDTLWHHWEAMEQIISVVMENGAVSSNTGVDSYAEVEKSLWNAIIFHQMLDHFLDWAHSFVESATLCLSNNTDRGRYEVQLLDTSPNATLILRFGVKALWHLLGFCEKLIGRTSLVRETLCFQEMLHPFLRLINYCQMVPSSSYSMLQQRLIFFLYQLCICLTSVTEIGIPDEIWMESMIDTVDEELCYMSTAHRYPLLENTLSIVRRSMGGCSSSLESRLANNVEKFYVKGSWHNYFLAPLIGALHNDDDVLSRWAKDTMIILLSFTDQVPSLTHFIAQESDFCVVVATGLGAIFSELPRELPLREWPEDWCQLQPKEWMNIPVLMNLLSSLEFCNYVIKVAHETIGDQMVELIYSGFIISIIAPFLHQTSLQEVVACTAYLELFLRRIRESRLLQVFLRFILCEEYEGIPILNTLITRINTNSDLCLVTLSLFRTLLRLQSEDVMYWLIFRYLQPPMQLSPSIYLQSHQSYEFLKDCYEYAARWFLELNQKPSCGKFVGDLPLDEFQYLRDISQRCVEAARISTHEWVNRYQEYMLQASHGSLIYSYPPYDRDSMDSLQRDGDTSLPLFHSEEISNPIEVFSDEEDDDSEHTDIAPKILNGAASVASLYRINYFDDEEDTSTSYMLEARNHVETPAKSCGIQCNISAEQIVTKTVVHKEIQAPDMLEHTDGFFSFLDKQVNVDRDHTNLGAAFFHNYDDMPDAQQSWLSVMSLEEEKELKSYLSEKTPSVFTSQRGIDYMRSEETLIWILSALQSPLLTTLLNKLKTFPSNVLFVNLLLTDILTQIASYPHILLHAPLLLFTFSRPLSLRPEMVLSLHHTMADVEGRIREFAAQLPHFSKYIQMAEEYLNGRIGEKPHPMSAYAEMNGGGQFHTSNPGDPNVSTKVNTKVDSKFTKRGSSGAFSLRLKKLFRRGSTPNPQVNPTNLVQGHEQLHDRSRCQTPMKLSSIYRFTVDNRDIRVMCENRRNRQLHIRGGVGQSHENLHSPLSAVVLDPERCAYECQRVRNCAFAYVIHREFCLELAALCKAHANAFSAQIHSPSISPVHELDKTPLL